jgi:hypothetical protein
MGLKPRPPQKNGEFAVGQVYSVELETGGWTACQIIDLAEKSIELLALRLLIDRPPTLAEVARAAPLVVTHHSWGDVVERLWVPRAPLPASFAGLGSCSLIYEPTETGISYGDAESIGLRIRHQLRWDAFPRAARDGYKRAIARRGENISIDLGDGKRSVSADATRIEVELDEPPSWSALDELGALTSLAYTGGDESIVDYLRGRPLISTLWWNAGGLTELDLRRTHLTEVSVRATGVRRLRLPDRCDTLRVQGDIVDLEICHGRKGAGVELFLFETRPALSSLRGLDALHMFTLCKVDAFDCSTLGRFADLHVVSLNDIGRIDNIDALGALPALHTIELVSCYDFDAAAFPAHVSRVDIDGLRKSDAVTLKKRLAGVQGLTIRGAKNEAWLKSNLHNPFRDWVDMGARKGKAACSAYTRALKAIAAGKKLETTLRAFVDAFNALDAKDGLDTADREDVFEAFGDLVNEAEAAADAKRWDEMFDRWRDF